MVALQPLRRRASRTCRVGSVPIGGDAPIVVQSMTNTDTADIAATVRQVRELWEAGSEIVRITVNDEAAARATPHIRDRLMALGADVPLVGCFHYNGHRLLEAEPALGEALAKLRINPGNVGFGAKKDIQFEQIVEAAIRFDRPIRIGVNWGSLDQALATRMMDENARLAEPADADTVMREALIRSALDSAARAVDVGLSPDKIIISAKLSRVQDLIAVYRALAQRCDHPLHLGLTEAGMGDKGVAATAAALSVLLQEGIGDTIRCSLTPRPGEARTREVEVCKNILQAMGLRAFKPTVTACPGCGRTTSTVFQELAQDVEERLATQMADWRKRYPGVETFKVAVMGCIVNGPGESKHADVGISLPGTGEQPAAPVFVDGAKAVTLRGPDIAEQFQAILDRYVRRRWGGEEIDPIGDLGDAA